MNKSGYGGRSTVNSIVANARKELETMKRSELPASRMSVNDGIRKPGNEVLEAAKHSLASLKTNPSQGRMKIASIPSVRSV